MYKYIGSRKRDKLESLFEVWRGWFSNERRSYLYDAWLDLIARALFLSYRVLPFQPNEAIYIYIYSGKSMRARYMLREPFHQQLSMNVWIQSVVQLLDRWINGWKTVCLAFNAVLEIFVRVCFSLSLPSVYIFSFRLLFSSSFSMS